MCGKAFSVLFTIVILGTTVLVLGSEDDGVVLLDEDSFDKRMNEQDGQVWLVEFYAPWCSLCIRFKERLVLLSKLLEGKVKVGVVNVDLNVDLMERFELDYVPAFMIFGEDKTNPKHYAGELTVAALMRAALNEFGKMK